MQSTNSQGNAKMSVRTLSKYQQDIHYPSQTDEMVMSIFSAEKPRDAWYTPSYEELRISDKGDDYNVLLNPNKDYSYLCSVSVRIVLPDLCVRDAYLDTVRICYPHHLLHIILRYASLNVDSIKVQELDTVTRNTIYQYFVKNKESYDAEAGNVDFLNNWTTHLPSFPISCEEPWFFSKCISEALPLHFTKKSDWQFNYTLERELINLVRMQIFTNGAWHDRPFHPKFMKNMVKESKPLIDKPTFEATYSVISPIEEAAYHEHYAKHDDHTIYYHDWVPINTPNFDKLGQAVDLTLSTQWPINVAFITFSNEKAMRLHDPCNRTTNPRNRQSGWCPAESVVLMNNETEILNRPADYFERLYNKGLPAQSNESGYLAHVFCLNMKNNSIQVGTTPKLSERSLKYRITLGDTHPLTQAKKLNKSKNSADDMDSIINIDDDIVEPTAAIAASSTAPAQEQEIYPGYRTVQNSQFKCHARLLVTRSLVLYKTENSPIFTKCRPTALPQDENVGDALFHHFDNREH